MNSNLMIRKIILDREKIEGFEEYPFNIEVVKNFSELEFTKQVSFFIGENGIGKSTFIEAIASNLKLNKEGGTENFTYKTNDTTSKLDEYLRLITYNKPKTKFFLRSESFYNFASEVERLHDEDGFGELYKYYGGNLHECSHGESFIKLIKNKFTDHGLYILDEPEAALSAQAQMTLLCLINDLVKKGSQFIIATHSPILISYREGEIFNLDNNFEKVKYEETNIYKTYKMYLENNEYMQSKLFDEEE